MKKYSQANMILLITTVLYLGISVAASFLIYGFNLQISDVALTLISQSMLLLPALIYMALRRLSPAKTLRMKKTKPVNFLMAILVLACAYPCVIILNIFSMFFVENAVVDSMTYLAESTPFIVGLGLFAIIPGFVEETLFRGVMYNTYSRIHPIAGMLVSAFCFGLMHGNFNQMPYAIFLGIVFALMLEATDSILVTMWMHFLLNSISVVAMYFSTDALSEISSDAASAAVTADATTNTVRAMFGYFYQLGGTMLLSVYACLLLCIALIFVFLVLLLIRATFKINRRNPRICFRAKQRNAHFIDGWLIAFVLLMIAEIVIDMII